MSDDLILDGIVTGKVPARGWLERKAQSPEDAIFLDQAEPISNKKSALASEDFEISQSYDNGLQFGTIIGKDKRGDAWLVWHGVEVNTRKLDRYVQETLEWKDLSDIGRSRKSSEWTHLLVAILRLERAHLLNRKSCRGEKELKDWLLNETDRKLDEKLIRHDVKLIWSDFVENHVDEQAISYAQFERCRDAD